MQESMRQIHREGKYEISSNIIKDAEKDRNSIMEKLTLRDSPVIDDYHFKQVKESSILTTETGCPVDDNQNSLTIGERGPILLQDSYLLEKLQHFTRERIPERVVHARGTGCYGYFELTEDITRYCKAQMFQKIGQQIPLFSRFSLVIATKGEPEAARDIRGFALKFYTEEGNWDLLCTNIPVFPVRDPIKMSDMVHAMKKHSQTNLYDPDAYWDFFSQSPESVHALSLIYSDKGLTDGYRHMHAFGNHTWRMINDKDEVSYVKFHLISEQKLKGLIQDEADRINGKDADYYTRDLYDNIAKGNFPTWQLCMQVMSESEATDYKWDIYDVTKVWPHSDYPLIKIGRVVLNKLPNNFFMESEQAAFNPSSLIPGIEPSQDRLLQARLFAYRDAQLYRLGTPNYLFISVNCPFKAQVANHERDGPFTISSGITGFPNYSPNSYGGPAPDQKYRIKPYEVSGTIGRFICRQPDDFQQANNFWTKVLNDSERNNLVRNICGFLGRANKEIQLRQCQLFFKVNEDFGKRVATTLGLSFIK
jgi:catalase